MLPLFCLFHVIVFEYLEVYVLNPKGLKAQLEQAKQHAAQYKAIADSIEHNLQEQSQVSILSTYS